MRASGRLPTILAAALLATFAGQAKAVYVEEIVDESADVAKKNPWRGSAITYENSFTARSLDKGADPTYNPYYAQSLVLRPEWHFGDQLYLRGNWIVEQELTTNDAYNKPHEIVLSDLMIDVGAAGWHEEWSGVRLSGALRFGLPVSKKSSAEQLRLSLAPGLSLSRRFDVLQGLVVGYQGRYTYNFRKYETAQYDGPRINCQPGEDCDMYSESGRRTASWSYGHGPSVILSATDKLSLATFYTHGRARLYDSEDLRVETDTGVTWLDGGGGYNWRDSEWFGIEAGYQIIDSVGVAVGVNTVHPQKQPDGSDYTRFFNRLTAFYLDINIDVDAVTKLF